VYNELDVQQFTHQVKDITAEEDIKLSKEIHKSFIGIIDHE
jgi:pterin-4a-carbinolamine dehydratase